MHGLCMAFAFCRGGRYAAIISMYKVYLTLFPVGCGGTDAQLKDELEDFIRDISPMLTNPDAVSSSQLQPSGTIVQALHDAVAWA